MNKEKGLMVNVLDMSSLERDARIKLQQMRPGKEVVRCETGLRWGWMEYDGSRFVVSSDGEVQKLWEDRPVRVPMFGTYKEGDRDVTDKSPSLVADLTVEEVDATPIMSVEHIEEFHKI